MQTISISDFIALTRSPHWHHIQDHCVTSIGSVIELELQIISTLGALRITHTIEAWYNAANQCIDYAGYNTIAMPWEANFIVLDAAGQEMEFDALALYLRNSFSDIDVATLEYELSRTV